MYVEGGYSSPKLSKILIEFASPSLNLVPTLTYQLNSLNEI